MRYLVGVDGGSSRCDALVVDETGRRLGRGHSGPIYAGNGRDHQNARVHLLDAIGEALANSGVSGAQLAGIFIGCSNWTAQRTAEVVEWLEPLEIPAAAVTVSDDADQSAAWAAARFPDPALVITLGTFWGSSAIADGREIAHLTDNLDLDQGAADLAEGSVIGSRALRAAITAGFGGPATLLYERICAELALNGVEALRQWAAEATTPDARAHLCQVAAQAAADGDAVAQSLFAEAAAGLARTTIAQAHYMNCASRPLTIALGGNVWRAGDPLLEPFRKAIGAALPQAAVVVNALSPEEGAALLALRIAHLRVTELHD